MSKTQRNFQFKFKGADNEDYLVVFFKLFKLKKHSQRHAYCVNMWSLETGFVGGICYLEVAEYPSEKDAQTVFYLLYEKHLGQKSIKAKQEGASSDVEES